MSNFSRSKATDQAIAGFTAGFTSTAILHPLDLIKTRFQADERVSRRSLLAAIPGIVKADGIRGLYRGLSANLTGSTLSWGLYFMFYSTIKDWMYVDGRLSPTQHLIASAEAGMITCMFTNPFWLMKTRICTQRASDKGAYKGLLDGLRQVINKEGFLALYRGIVPALIGVSHGALQFMAYEELKHLRSQYQSNDKLDAMEYIAFAAASKVFATVLTYPYQVVKTRIQVKNQFKFKNPWLLISLL